MWAPRPWTWIKRCASTRKEEGVLPNSLPRHSCAKPARSFATSASSAPETKSQGEARKLQDLRAPVALSKTLESRIFLELKP